MEEEEDKVTFIWNRGIANLATKKLQRRIRSGSGSGSDLYTGDRWYDQRR